MVILACVLLPKMLLELALELSPWAPVLLDGVTEAVGLKEPNSEQGQWDKETPLCLSEGQHLPCQCPFASEDPKDRANWSDLARETIGLKPMTWLSGQVCSEGLSYLPCLNNTKTKTKTTPPCHLPSTYYVPDAVLSTSHVSFTSRSIPVTSTIPHFTKGETEARGDWPKLAPGDRRVLDLNVAPERSHDKASLLLSSRR